MFVSQWLSRKVSRSRGFSLAKFWKRVAEEMKKESKGRMRPKIVEQGGSIVIGHGTNGLVMTVRYYPSFFPRESAMFLTSAIMSDDDRNGERYFKG